MAYHTQEADLSMSKQEIQYSCASSPSKQKNLPKKNKFLQNPQLKCYKISSCLEEKNLQ